MKLWLDDVRPPPDDTWKWVKTVEEAQAFMREYEVTIASLDHDLGFEADPNSSDPRDPDELTLDQYLIARSRPGADGINLVYWMVEEDIFPTEHITIHSWNPDGARKMYDALTAACDTPCVLKPFELSEDLKEEWINRYI